MWRKKFCAFRSVSIFDHCQHVPARLFIIVNGFSIGGPGETGKEERGVAVIRELSRRRHSGAPTWGEIYWSEPDVVPPIGHCHEGHAASVRRQMQIDPVGFG